MALERIALKLAKEEIAHQHIAPIKSKNPIGRPGEIWCQEATLLSATSRDPPRLQPQGSIRKKKGSYTNWFAVDTWPLIEATVKQHWHLRDALHYLWVTYRYTIYFPFLVINDVYKELWNLFELGISIVHLDLSCSLYQWNLNTFISEDPWIINLFNEQNVNFFKFFLKCDLLHLLCLYISQIVHMPIYISNSFTSCKHSMFHLNLFSTL